MASTVQPPSLELKLLPKNLRYSKFMKDLHTHKRKLKGNEQVKRFCYYLCFSHGVLKIENEVTNKVFKVNGHKIKLFHESPQMEEEFMVNLSMVLSPILCYDAP